MAMMMMVVMMMMQIPCVLLNDDDADTMCFLAPLGGGQFVPLTLLFFLNGKKTVARSAAKISVSSRTSI